MHHLQEHGNEMSCIGACTKPVKNPSYDYAGNCMYLLRSYSGCLYENGASTKTVSKVHPGDVVRIVADMKAGELRFFVNDDDLGVCFSSLSGLTIYPCVSLCVLSQSE